MEKLRRRASDVIFQRKLTLAGNHGDFGVKKSSHKLVTQGHPTTSRLPGCYITTSSLQIFVIQF